MPLNMSVYTDQFTGDIRYLFLIALAAALYALWRRNLSIPHLFCCFVFGIYLIYALDKAFFPLHISGTYAEEMRQIPTLAFINFNPFFFGVADTNIDPFNLGRRSSISSALPGLLLNLALTLPFGLGINFVRKIKPKQIWWVACGVGFAIEGMQLLLTLLLRYPYREVDINDVLMNALGVLIGYGFFLVFARLYVQLTLRFGIVHSGLGAYIYEVTNEAVASANSDS